MTGQLNYGKLADFVSARRNFLELTQEDLRIAGGPSNATVTAIETNNLRGNGISAATLRKLDRSLQLEFGTTQRVLEGADIPFNLRTFAFHGVDAQPDDRVELNDRQLRTVLRTVSSVLLSDEIERRMKIAAEAELRIGALEEAFRAVRA